MVHTSFPTVLRSGVVSVKRAGITSWKGWKDRWLVLKPSALVAYKNFEIVFTLLLDQLKHIECKSVSNDHRQCLLLTVQGGAQYYLSFQRISDLNGWYSDIYSSSSLAPSLITVENTAYEQDDYVLDGFTDDDSPISVNVPFTMPVRALDLADTTAASIVDGGNRVEALPRTWPDIQPETTVTAPSSLDHQSFREDTDLVTLKPHERVTLQDAITTLCKYMAPRLLRISDPGGEKRFDLVEIRLRPLLRVKRKWTKEPSPDVDKETVTAFCDALKDGYVLCQFMNTIHCSPILRPTTIDTVNILQFLGHCRDCGLSEEWLFLPSDVAASTSRSATRVARTIIALVKAATPSSRKATNEALVRFSKQGLAKLHEETSCIEVWIDKFIASKEGMISRHGEISSVPELSPRAEKTPIVYQNLVAYLAEMTCDKLYAYSDSLRRALDKLVTFMVGLDPVSTLLECRQLRIRLLQISAELHVSDNRILHEALKKDDMDLAKLLFAAVNSDEYTRIILGLQGEDAQNCVDLVHDVLNKNSPGSVDEGFYHKARRVLVKLSESQDVLPSTLFIKGVQREEADACFGGAFADIFRASFKGQQVALKRIRVFQDDDRRHQIRRRFCREALLWQKLRHPFVLPFCGIDSESFPSFLCMVSPWMRHGTVLKHLAETGYANVEARLLEIAHGLEYLHSQNVVHGDLRGSNILVNDEWHALLADFGLTVFSDVTVTTHTSHSGSVRWMAPELHHPQSFGLKHFRRTFASDVYSFACVCVELFTGKPPFAELPHETAAMLKAVAGERPERPCDNIGRVMPDYLWDIVQMCWKHNIPERPKISQVVEMMKAANISTGKVSTIPPAEAIDWDATLHCPDFGGTNLVRGRKLANRSAAVRHTRTTRHRFSQSG